jgi:hypothetical protein
VSQANEREADLAFLFLIERCWREEDNRILLYVSLFSFVLSSEIVAPLECERQILAEQLIDKALKKLYTVCNIKAHGRACFEGNNMISAAGAAQLIFGGAI